MASTFGNVRSDDGIIRPPVPCGESVVSIKLYAPTRRHFLQCLLTTAAAAAACQRLAAEESPRAGDSSRAVQEQAVRAIPLSRLTPSAQSKVNYVLQKPSYFRRMPRQSFPCDPVIFTEIVRYPELLIGMWDAMGATQVEVERIAPYIFRGDDAAGTRCTAELLYGDESLHVYYAVGDYTGRLTQRTVEGASLCVLHNRPWRDRSGDVYETADMDVFLRIDSFGADLIVRSLSPLVAGTADQNFTETTRFVSQISEASRENPQGLQALVERLRFVDEPVKERFSAQILLSAQRYAQRSDTRNY